MQSKPERSKPKLLIAAGGTGGHLYPAQALASELKQTREDVELLFAGAGLATNRYFHKELYAFEEVASATPFRGNIFKAPFTLFRGIKSSKRLLEKFQPDLIIGFGSYHSFPLLAAAKMKGIPFILFESNAAPGKVNRLFSRWAVMTAVHFAHASKKLSGTTFEVAMPLGAHKPNLELDQKKAREFFGLKPDLFTILVFGGSQGALSINKIFCQAAAQLSTNFPHFQVLHLTGHRNDIDEVRRAYSLLDIPVCIKEFEENMLYAWKSANLAICRSGAGTLAELLAYQVPAILIPYPHAADNHQCKNAEVMESEVKGARLLLEAELSPERLYGLLNELIAHDGLVLKEMQKSISHYKMRGRKSELSQLIGELLFGISK